MAKPQNLSFNGAFDMPTQPEVADDPKEKNTYRISKSKQWQGQLDYLQGRIETYMHDLPGSKSLKQLTNEERGQNWAIADAVIREINLWVNEVQNIADGVEDAR